MTKKELFKNLSVTAKTAYNAKNENDRIKAENVYSQIWREIDRNYPDARTFNIAINRINGK